MCCKPWARTWLELPEARAMLPRNCTAFPDSIVLRMLDDISDVLLMLGDVLSDVNHCFLIHYGVAITDTARTEVHRNQGHRLDSERLL
jgi:hypothetical protein